MATVADVLAHKGNRVYTVSPTATVLEATRRMNRHKIGALVVTSSSVDDADSCTRVAGMITERDVLMRLVGEQRDAAHTLVEEIMTVDVAFCRMETSLDEVSAMMRERRIRHLPVCDADGGELRGMI